jgi:diguanylate cyclase (GGDEF)-like protein/putative nucleotidyltransferase with HDIG domain
LGVAPPNSCAQEFPVEESLADDLTGLKTRCYFMEALDGEWRRSTRTGGQFSLTMMDLKGFKRANDPNGYLPGDKVLKALTATARQFSLIMMDLDRFKQVNERMGRLEGDKVLTAVAALLGDRSRQRNVAARYGEDEFAILMPETNTQQAEIVAEELRATVEADDILRTHEVTGSFGVATFPDHGASQVEVLWRAKFHMYEAKHYRNCVKAPHLRLMAGDADLSERQKANTEAGAKQWLSERRDEANPHLRKFQQTKYLSQTITAMALLLEAYDPYTAGHSKAVSWLAAQIAIQAGISEAEVEEIRLAGLVHDIGKLDVPEEVLKKPALLTAEEYEVMKTHAAWGAKMLEPLKGTPIERIVRHHHERYDGRGYPDHLMGEKIPLGARIVAVAECFHDMVSDHPYRSARTFEDALAELRRCSGTQFDPRVVTAFLDWLEIHGDPRSQQ